MLEYKDFRTGYTFADVYHMLYNRKWKRRNGVLGYWRELKQRMYEEYVRNQTDKSQDYVPCPDPIPD